MPPRRLTCEEVANLYGVPVRTVWGWIRKNRLKAIQIHDGYKNKYRIRPEDLEAFENERLTTREAS